MDKLKSAWSTMNPKHKRIFAVSAFAAAMVIALGVFGGDKMEDLPKGHKETIKNVLTDKSMRAVGMDSLSADLRLIARTQDDMKREFERMKTESKQANAKGGGELEASRASVEVERLRKDVNDLMSKNDELRELVAAAPKQAALARDPSSLDADPGDPHSVFGRTPSGAGGSVSVDGQMPNGDGAEPGGKSSGGLKIASISQHSAKGKDKGKDGKEEDEGIYLPAGSILTGVLINGMDAPTGQGARRDPFPSTLRIQKEAVLPNRFRADVRECFLIVSGYGDLSSERAYLRGETISCVREDGGVIEARLDSYAIGEDGKAGVRGRLVSKQGQIIAKSLMAGFLSGAAEALDVKQMPVINLNTTGGNLNSSRNQYQNSVDGDLLKGAGFKGASGALERIAQYYVSMAEGIFPVIEVDAGRQLDVIMTRGVKLQVKGNKGKK